LTIARSSQWETLVSTADRAQELIVWTADAASPAADGLRRLKDEADLGL
jgi:hypothetical protein